VLFPGLAVTAVGVPVSDGDVNSGLVNVLLVKVSVPANVAKVPVVGRVIFVAALLVKVVENAPAVVNELAVIILPPSVIVFPVLATPVPPLAPATVPVTLPAVVAVLHFQ
jgi:hypothetical protein